MIVEKARLCDLPEVVSLTMLSEEERVGPLGALKESAVANDVLSNWLKAPCFLLKENSSIVGFAGLVELQPFGQTDKIYTDYFFYIQPEHRSIYNLRLLTQAARDFADKQGVPLVLMYMHKDNPKAHDRLLKQQGFKVIGSIGKYGEY